MADIPLLSVVVPVFNGEKFMDSCLGSIKASVQALPPTQRGQVEIIICDNHSTDRTLEMAKAADFGCVTRLVQPLQHCENRTQNWDFGLREARGVWMMMLHADDRLAPGGLGVLLRACEQERESGVVLISGKHRSFTDETAPGGLKPDWPFASRISGEALRRRVLGFNCPFVPFTVMRRAVYLSVGGLNDRYELVQDWDLWIRILAQGSLYYTPEEVGHWRLHGFSPKYATIFGREHLLLVSEIRRLIPAMTPEEADDALQFQFPRVQVWLPETPFETLVADAPERDRILALPRTPPEDAREQIRRTNRRFGLTMNWLRVLGTLRPARDSVAPPGGMAARSDQAGERRT